MAYEQKPNSGSLFKNDRKEADTHADYRGTASIGGVDFWLDAWINKSANGTSYMSLKFKLKDVQQPPRETPSQGYAPAQSDLDDDVPF